MTASAIEGSAVPLAFVQGEPVTQRSTRALLGWLPDQEAAHYLLGHAPTPLDDLSTIGPRVATCKAAVQARPPTVTADPIMEGDRTLLDQAEARPELLATFGIDGWRVEWVDLTKVFALQKIITTDALDRRVEGTADSPTALLELCLPTEQPIPPPHAFLDHNGPGPNGVTLSSPNVNLRAAGVQVSEVEVALVPGTPSRRMRAVTFLIDLQASYLQVVYYNGRHTAKPNSNNRPRQTLDWLKPTEVLNKLLLEANGALTS